MSTRYIVVRVAPELQHEWPGFDGRWYERQMIDRSRVKNGPWAERTAVATGLFETREDGEVAEVFEIRSTAIDRLPICANLIQQSRHSREYR